MKISTHTSRVGCDGVPSISVSWYKISTHTSRVGCDAESNQIAAAYINISTHTSRVGCDTFSKMETADYILFLLTHPVWDVTKYI